MENATDALYMAFAVLAFVIALSISIFAFSAVTSASQSIINYRDRETTYDYIDPNKTSEYRIVTREDIVSTLYRICNENYIVKFEGFDSDFLDITVQKTTETNGKETKESVHYSTNTLDFASFKVSEKRIIVDAILTGNSEELEKYYGIKLTGLQNNGLYGIMKGMTFEEHAGIFNTDKNEDDEVNKTEKRVLTYVLRN